MSAPPILAAEGLAIGYPGRRVGEGLDLALQPGETVALLGPNGGGKTTLLRTLLGLLAPQAGRVLLDGRPLARFSPRARARRLAYVPQSHASAFGFSLREMVEMGRTAHAGLLAAPSAADRAATDEAIARLGLTALAERPIGAVSGGERQLALIARALAQRPAAILLDEPTASLDFANQGLVLRELGRLAGQGLAVLFATHDPNHARRLADRALLIRDGGALAAGPAASVLTRAALEALYQAPVAEIAGQGGAAFLPG